MQKNHEITANIENQNKYIIERYTNSYKEEKIKYLVKIYKELLLSFGKIHSDFNCVYEPKRGALYESTFSDSGIKKNFEIYIDIVSGVYFKFDTTSLELVQTCMQSLVDGKAGSIENMNQYIQINIKDPIWNFHHRNIAHPESNRAYKASLAKMLIHLPTEVQYLILHHVEVSQFPKLRLLNRPIKEYADRRLKDLKDELTALWIDKEAKKNSLLTWIEQAIRKQALPVFWEPIPPKENVLREPPPTKFNQILRTLFFFWAPQLNLQDVAFDLSNCDLRTYGETTPNIKILENKRIYKAKNASLTGLSIKGANLENADCRNSDFSHVDLSSSNMTNADMRSSIFSCAILNESNLENAKMDGCSFFATKFKKSNLKNSSFDDCEFDENPFCYPDLFEDAVVNKASFCNLKSTVPLNKLLKANGVEELKFSIENIDPKYIFLDKFQKRVTEIYTNIFKKTHDIVAITALLCSMISDDKHVLKADISRHLQIEYNPLANNMFFSDFKTGFTVAYKMQKIQECVCAGRIRLIEILQNFSSKEWSDIDEQTRKNLAILSELDFSYIFRDADQLNLLELLRENSNQLTRII